MTKDELKFEAFKEVAHRYFNCTNEDIILRAWTFFHGATSDVGQVTQEDINWALEHRLTNDLPPRDVVKTLKEFIDSQNNNES